jgi:proline iminopeptidase
MRQTEKFIHINGLDIYVKMLGTGDPIVFLHGGPGVEHRYFLPHVEPLAEHFTLVFYDQRGCGQSQRAENPLDYSMGQEVATLEGLRRALGFERINVLGHSWGSILALLYAASHSTHVHKLMLVSAVGATSAGLKRFGEELMARMTPEDKERYNQMEEKIKTGKVRYEHAIEELLTHIIYPYYFKNSQAQSRLTKANINTDVNKALSADIITNYNLTSTLPGLSRIPVLAAQGVSDLITPDAIKDLLLKYMPFAELNVFEQSGHFPFIEESARFNEAAYEFFR